MCGLKYTINVCLGIEFEFIEFFNTMKSMYTISYQFFLQNSKQYLYNIYDTLK